MITLTKLKKFFQVENNIDINQEGCYVGFDGSNFHSIESLHDEFESWYCGEN